MGLSHICCNNHIPSAKYSGYNSESNQASSGSSGHSKTHHLPIQLHGGSGRVHEGLEFSVVKGLCHDPNSGQPKIWPVTPGQRLDPKGSSYSMLAVNQNTLDFLFFFIFIFKTAHFTWQPLKPTSKPNSIPFFFY